MADLKPIGSEKLQGQDKLNRILEIARYKENIPKTVNETAKVEFGKTLSDGNQYEIVKEKGGYVLMKRINESLDYIEPMKNRRHYKSYSQALKRLNLMAGEINRLTENVEEVSMFRVDEEKKFTLKLPKPSTPEPAPAPEVSMDCLWILRFQWTHLRTLNLWIWVLKLMVVWKKKLTSKSFRKLPVNLDKKLE